MRPELTPIDSGGKPEKPKPEDLTNSPFRDFGNPPPPPSRPSSQPPPPPPGGDQPSQSSHDHGDRARSHSSGQGTSSDSGKKDGADSSKAEDSNDADRGKDETRVHDELLDYGDGQEDDYIPGLMAGLGPNRQPKYSSLDVIGVKQLLEVRPFTVDRIIATSDSFETACGHLFAFPEDVGGVEVIGRAWRLFQGGGGGSEDSCGGVRTDAQETFTLDDVRQFTEIDLANAALDEGEAERYELMLEKVFEYDIEWGTKKANKLTQLQNLAKANMHIVNYFAVEEGFKLGEKKALEEFKKHFSETDQGKLQVRLGANDETKGASLGRVPLPQSTEMNLDTIFLGSQVDIPTIVHEFGHVMDRNINMTAYLEGRLGDGKFRLMKADDKSGVNLNSDILYYVIEGFVAKQFFGRELLADLFMTAVLSGEGYKVKSVNDPTYNEAREITYDPIAIFATFNDPDGPTFVCGADPPCFTRNVEWESTNNARVVRAFLPKVFLHARSERERK